MKHQVFMSPKNGQLVVGIPLFQRVEQESAVPGYSVYFESSKNPDAFIVHADHLLAPQLMSAEWIYKHMTCLGDL